MNKTKGIILCSLITILITTLLGFCFMTEESYAIPTSIYQVYLDGEKIGLINSKDELYKLINKEQVEIKDEYKVDQVYPPKGFKIIKKNTYDENVTTVADVYEEIKDQKEFTIKGYTITIKSNVEGAEPVYIYVLDKKIFEKAVNNIVVTFIGEERYDQYLNEEQPEIVDTGYIIEKMEFEENISIKESYISVEDKIYTDANELTKYLLFGENISIKEYKVKQGDTVAKIAEENQLNVSELLIANDNIKTEDALLAIGQTVNVALIDPVLTLVYDVYLVQDVEQQFEKEIVKDSTKYNDYKKVTTEGVNGINRIAQSVQFKNGEQMAGAYTISTQVIRPVQNQITTIGTKIKFTGNGQTGTYVDTGDAWAWPTNSPYVITSHYGYRWGTLHDGMDISGTGYGSPIYAVLDGEVYQAQWGGVVGNSAGYNVVIKHDNGMYTVYAHCSKLYVKKGQRVTRRQKIAAMGSSGVATGTHLHLGVFTGVPYNGGKSIDPRKLWS